MPGWLIHMETARRAVDQLATNTNAQDLFAQSGPSASDLQAIAHRHPAYVALGAIGPDIFFMLPDFKPQVGSALFGAAATVKDIYNWLDVNFLGPWQDMLGPIEDNNSDTLGALTGGLSTQIYAIINRAASFFIDTIKVMAIRNIDAWSFLGSGVINGYDEHTFFWSDMFHYRKTYEFTRHLWAKATKEAYEEGQAFALGWMTHLGCDVTGHCLVNQKCGGPYRLHWQRHHLIENHMDARIYDTRFGVSPLYSSLNSSALHLWFAFNPDGTSHNDIFQTQPGPDYPTGDRTPDLLGRRTLWDVDSDLPDDLADFIASAVQEYFNDSNPDLASDTGQWASHPTIIEDYQPGSGGYPDAKAVATTYWWLYHIIKYLTTDYYKVRRPQQPDAVIIASFPSPPGSGTADPGPGEHDDNPWHDILSILLAILAWFLYIAQVLAYPIVAIIGIITSAATAPIRNVLYENFELPLYNMWAALHWFMSMTGFTYPMKGIESTPALTTLGVGFSDVWGAVWAALQDPAGGLVPPATTTEPSGSHSNERYPHDLVADPDSVISSIPSPLPKCNSFEIPSEFLRPWLWPERDNENDPVPLEKTTTLPDFHVAGDDPTALMGGSPGDNPTRKRFAECNSSKESDDAASDNLPSHHLGDSVDYAAFVIAQLTRDTAEKVANFNLDADRGYGYLCWDFRRFADTDARPAAYSHPSTHDYKAPQQPGAGWCEADVTSKGSVAPVPVMHVNGTANPPVQIRYLDREKKDV